MHQSWRETIGHAMRPFWAGSGVPANILKRLINLEIDEEAIVRFMKFCIVSLEIFDKLNYLFEGTITNSE